MAKKKVKDDTLERVRDLASLWLEAAAESAPHPEDVFYNSIPALTLRLVLVEGAPASVAIGIMEEWSTKLGRDQAELAACYVLEKAGFYS